MAEAASRGRTWWAHFEFTRTNIEPIILKNKIEELRVVSASHITPPSADPVAQPFLLRRKACFKE